MSGDRSKTDSSSSSAGLLLRVQRANGQTEEFYLANGLTIGRTVANTIVLADDDAAARTHARGGLLGDRCPRLSCVGPGTEVYFGDTAVQEVGLTAGVTFRIGATNFQCISGLRLPEVGRSDLGSACPLCGAKDLPPANTRPAACRACGQAIFSLNLGGPHPNVFAVPVTFGNYRAERFIARGGMGLVFQGVAEADKQPVAIKILMPGRVDRQAAERFQQEIVLMQRVCHHNVVRLSVMAAPRNSASSQWSGLTDAASVTRSAGCSVEATTSIRACAALVRAGQQRSGGCPRRRGDSPRH